MTTAAPSTALTQAQSGGLAAFAGPNNPFLAAANKIGVTDGIFLRMNGKTGEYLTNDNRTLAPETELVFLMMQASRAWQGFDNENKLHKGPEVKILSGLELPAHPGTAGVKWQEVIKVLVAPTDGGKQMTFTAKANNQYREIWRLVKKYGEQVSRFPDGKKGYKSPIVQLGARSYDMKVQQPKVDPVTKHFVVDPKTGQPELEEVKIQNFSETLTIVAWISDDEMAEIAAAAKQEESDVQNAGGDPPAQLPAPSASAPVVLPPVVPQPTVAVPVPAPAAVVGVTAQVQTSPPPAKPGFRQGRVGQRV